MDENKKAATSCDECRHQRKPKVPVLRTVENPSAEMIEALMSGRADRERTEANELQRAQAGEPFVRRPQSLEWCFHYTPSEKLCKEINDALKFGNDDPLKNAEERGLEFVNENGRMRPVYAICVLKNDGQCAGFNSPGGE